jgi:hypothetical protein
MRFWGAVRARHARRRHAWIAIVCLAGALLFVILHLADKTWKATPSSLDAPTLAGVSPQDEPPSWKE